MGVDTGRQVSIPKRERILVMYWCCESCIALGVCLISIPRMYLWLPFTVTLHCERRWSIRRLISQRDPAVVMSSTYTTTIILWSALMKTQGSKGRDIEPISATASESFSNHASGACLRPYSTLSSRRMFPSRPIPGGGIIQISSTRSTFKNADLIYSWSVSRPRWVAVAMMRRRESYRGTGANVSS